MQTEAEKENTGTEKETLGTKSEIEVLAGCKRRIKASVPVDRVREELDKNYRELANTIQLPGFRRGRVPRKLLEARYGEEIDGDVKQALLAGSLSEVVEEKELKVIGSPRFDNIQFGRDADMSYEVELEVRPEFDVGEYRGVEVVFEPEKVTDEAVEERVRALQRRDAKYVPVETAEAGADDIFEGLYSLHREGARVKAGEKTTFIPSTGVLDAFHVHDLAERIASWDRSSGEPLRLDVKVPPDYPDEVLRGADVNLELTLTGARRAELPELTDEFARAHGKETIAELRAELRKHLEEWSQREQARKIEAKIVEKISSAVAVDLPEALLEALASRGRHDREYELLEKGMSQEEANQALVKEGPVASEDIRRELKDFFILEKIGEREKIYATEDDIAARIHTMAALYGVLPARLFEELRESGRLEEVRIGVRHQKVRSFLRKHASVKGPDEQPLPLPESLPVPGMVPRAEEPAAESPEPESAEASAPEGPRQEESGAEAPRD